MSGWSTGKLIKKEKPPNNNDGKYHGFFEITTEPKVIVFENNTISPFNVRVRSN